VLAGDPDDLLDRNEAPRLLKHPVAVRTWVAYVEHFDFLSERVVLVAGVKHHRRADILAWDAARRGRGRRQQGRGRGTDIDPRPQTLERLERVERARQLVATMKNRGRQPTGAELAGRLGVSERTGQRLLIELGEGRRQPRG
jgi:hypothetical protein